MAANQFPVAAIFSAAGTATVPTSQQMQQTLVAVGVPGASKFSADAVPSANGKLVVVAAASEEAEPLGPLVDKMLEPGVGVDGKFLANAAKALELGQDTILMKSKNKRFPNDGFKKIICVLDDGTGRIVLSSGYSDAREVVVYVTSRSGVLRKVQLVKAGEIKELRPKDAVESFTADDGFKVDGFRAEINFWWKQLELPGPKIVQARTN